MHQLGILANGPRAEVCYLPQVAEGTGKDKIEILSAVAFDDPIRLVPLGAPSPAVACVGGSVPGTTGRRVTAILLGMEALASLRDVGHIFRTD